MVAYALCRVKVILGKSVRPRLGHEHVRGLRMHIYICIFHVRASRFGLSAFRAASAGASHGSYAALASVRSVQVPGATAMLFA